MVDTSVVVFNTIPPPIPTTADEIGCQLACDSADKQAAMLLAFSVHVKAYEHGASWPMQCRAIAEQLSIDECDAVFATLYTLQEHLEAISQERRVRQVMEQTMGGAM